MARKRDPKRDQSFKIFKAHDGSISNREIAKVLEIDEKKIAVWKSRDKWVQQLEGNIESCTTKKTTTTKKKPSKRDEQQKRIVDSLVEAGTYSPALDLLIEVYLDCYDEYQQMKDTGENTEKLRKELAKLLGQLGLDGKNKELIKKSGVLLAKGDEEEGKEKKKEPEPEDSKLVQFRKRQMRG